MTKFKSTKPKVFKFEKGQTWDGDESIINYIQELLLDYSDISQSGCPKVKEKTYITIYCQKEIRKIIQVKKGWGRSYGINIRNTKKRSRK